MTNDEALHELTSLILKDSQPIDKDKLIVVRESWYNNLRELAQRVRPGFIYHPPIKPLTQI